MTTHLELPPEITVAAYFDEDADLAVQQLEHVAAVVKARHGALASADQREWPGEKTTVVIVPSSAVLRDHRAERLVQGLARTCRVAGITLRLIDVATEIRSSIEDRMVYPSNHFGSVMIRQFALDPEIRHVTFHALKPSEMVQMAETFGRQIADQ